MSGAEGDSPASHDAEALRQPELGHDDETGFAPSDLTDGRAENDWKSRYREPRAVAQIIGEGTYLAVLLVGAALALLLVWIGTPRPWLGIGPARYVTFQSYGYAWIGGTLGGTVLAIKWLYHSIGKGIWNVDRLAWRLFTPHLSGAFAFGLIALATSGVFEILNRQLLRSGPAAVGTGFILGYFSDYTVARLYELAKHLFGDSESPHP
jgi:hypothetical protein